MGTAEVAIQGERGAFSHQAAVAVMGEGVTLRPQPTLRRRCSARWRTARPSTALLPIENSLAGSIHENYDRLKAAPLHIVGETQLRVRHCLLARPGASLGRIRRVASHPVALAQCRRFFAERPHIEPVPAYDTAGSVRDLLRGGMATQAAIASRLAAEIYGAQVLMEGIEDDPQNYTRFLLLAREPRRVAGTCKTSLVFTCPTCPVRCIARWAPSPCAAWTSRRSSRARCAGGRGSTRFYLDVLGDPRGRPGRGGCRPELDVHRAARAGDVLPCAPGIIPSRRAPRPPSPSLSGYGTSS